MLTLPITRVYVEEIAIHMGGSKGMGVARQTLSSKGISRGALEVACVTGFGSALTSTHMYDTPSNIPHHTKCDGEC